MKSELEERLKLQKDLHKVYKRKKTMYTKSKRLKRLIALADFINHIYIYSLIMIILCWAMRAPVKLIR